VTVTSHRSTILFSLMGPPVALSVDDSMPRSCRKAVQAVHERA
jgi:hypothetical protein